MAKKVDTFTCNRCGKSMKIERNYYQSKDNFMCSEEIIPVCKNCLQEIFEVQRTQIGDRSAIRNLLRRVDLPYINSVVERALKANNPIGQIFKEYNSYNKYNSLSYDNSDLFPNFSSDEAVDENGISLDTRDFTNDDKTRWSGYGLTLEQMLYCKSMYEEMINKYELDSINDLLSAEQYAATAVKMQEAFKKGSASDIERYRKTISSIESDLAIQSKQLKNDSDKDTWGLFIKHIENDEPIDEAEPKEEFKDVDGIGKLIKRYIIGYLPVMLGKQKPQDILEDDFDILGKE